MANAVNTVITVDRHGNPEGHLEFEAHYAPYQEYGFRHYLSGSGLKASTSCTTYSRRWARRDRRPVPGLGERHLRPRRAGSRSRQGV